MLGRVRDLFPAAVGTEAESHLPREEAAGPSPNTRPSRRRCVAGSSFGPTPSDRPAIFFRDVTDRKARGGPARGRGTPSPAVREQPGGRLFDGAGRQDLPRERGGLPDARANRRGDPQPRPGGRGRRERRAATSGRSSESARARGASKGSCASGAPTGRCSRPRSTRPSFVTRMASSAPASSPSTSRSESAPRRRSSCSSEAGAALAASLDTRRRFEPHPVLVPALADVCVSTARARRARRVAPAPGRRLGPMAELPRDARRVGPTSGPSTSSDRRAGARSR